MILVFRMEHFLGEQIALTKEGFDSRKVCRFCEAEIQGDPGDRKCCDQFIRMNFYRNKLGANSQV